MENKASLIRKIKEKFGATVEPWPEQEEIDQDAPILAPNRRDKRRARQYGSTAGTGSVHDALRLGSRPGRAKRATGQPLWFRQMKYEAARRNSLEKVTMDRLEPAVGQVALDLYHAGYKTVWAVTQVEDASALLSETVSTLQLSKLRSYLVQQRVPVKWEV